MDRPVIGIATSLVEASWSVWQQPAALTPYNYIRAIHAAGGIALMIPPDPAFARDPDQILDLVDALILAGGNDIGPSTYGAEPHPETHGVVSERDDSELALARRAWERDMPVLGICRGMQLLNVSRGGTLLQHLPDEVGHGEHRINPGSFDGADHDVKLDADSLAARAAGEEVHVTKSHHHQGVDVVGDGLQVTGHSALGDGLPEALEAPDRRFMLGVQWHPEADETSTVISAVVDEARAYRSTRASA